METLFIGKNLLFLHEVESTNTYAMNLLRNVNTLEGTVIYTDNQTKGKGQRGSVWASKIGQNLTTSIILKPHFLALNNTYYLSKISALAVYDLLTEILVNSHYDIKIKWPNDILVDKKKIAGILIENNFTNTSLHFSIVGIGLNVNQIEFETFEREATSLKLLTDMDYDRNALLQKLCEKLEKWYLILKQQNMKLINESYLNNLFGYQQINNFEDVNHLKLEGKIIDVSKEGKLIIKQENQGIREFDNKEVKFLF